MFDSLIRQGISSLFSNLGCLPFSSHTPTFWLYMIGVILCKSHSYFSPSSWESQLPVLQETRMAVLTNVLALAHT